LNLTDTPFFATLAQEGQLKYPFFGISLERNASYGYLSIGEACCPPVNGLPPDLGLVGAVDSTIVTNVSLIEWIEVIPFEPVGTASNVSSYLQWAIPISNITVSNLGGLRLMLMLQLAGREPKLRIATHVSSRKFQPPCGVVRHVSGFPISIFHFA